MVMTKKNIGKSQMNRQKVTASFILGLLHNFRSKIRSGGKVNTAIKGAIRLMVSIGFSVENQFIEMYEAPPLNTVLYMKAVAIKNTI